MPDHLVEVTFFPNGMCMAFMDGEQVPELQQWSYVLMHAERAKSLGYDPTKIRYRLPDGHMAEVFEIEEGRLNYQVV